MKRWLFSLTLLLVLAGAAQAHFVWIVPASGQDVQAVFSDSLEPDEAVAIDKIAATKLLARKADGKTVPVTWTKGENAYSIRWPEGAEAIGGVCRYGILQRGEGKPFLLAYYPKFVRDAAVARSAWEELHLDIVPQGKGRFRVLFRGKAVATTEITALTPDGKKTATTDDRGEFELATTAPGVYGLRVRHIEATAGADGDKKFEEVKHYATLVFRTPDKSPGVKSPSSPYAALPRAVSSFGAVVADGWLYIYGGHCAKTHTYATDSVVGTFHRLKLAEPTRWQELSSGPGLQGLALVEHKGKIYRIGGMRPRNQPGEPADNHSLTTCARFDPSNGKWEDLPDLPEARSSHDAVVVGDKLIVSGGWKLNGGKAVADWHATTLVLDLARPSLQWQIVKQPFQRRALTAAVFGNKAYVIGGMDSETSLARSVDIYDPRTNTWTTGPEIPGPKRNGFTPAAAVMGERLFVSTGDGKVFQLNAKSNAWEEVGELQQARRAHRMVAGNGSELLAIGGANSNGNVAETEAVTPREVTASRP